MSRSSGASTSLSITSGHAEKWDKLEIDGDINGPDCLVRYRRGDKVLAVASIYRDLENLKEEAAMERSAVPPHSRRWRNHEKIQGR
jgi:hypothetical protein